jgi:hypothetical protein
MEIGFQGVLNHVFVDDHAVTAHEIINGGSGAEKEYQDSFKQVFKAKQAEK